MDDRNQRLENGERVFLGSSIYQKCFRCGKVIKMNKFILGSFHLCTSDENDQRKETK